MGSREWGVGSLFTIQSCIIISIMDMRYKSEIFEVVHQDAIANFDIGAISETEMQEFDEMCLVQEPATEYKASQKPILEHSTA